MDPLICSFYLFQFCVFYEIICKYNISSLILPKLILCDNISSIQTMNTVIAKPHICSSIVKSKIIVLATKYFNQRMISTLPCEHGEIKMFMINYTIYMSHTKHYHMLIVEDHITMFVLQNCNQIKILTLQRFCIS